MLEALKNLWENTGLFKFTDAAGNFDLEYLLKTLAMYVIIGVLVFLAVKKGFEPLLLLPIAFGMLLANIPGANIFHSSWFIDGVPTGALAADGTEILAHDLKSIIGYAIGNGGLIDILYIGVKTGLYPCLIFIGVGAMTDFSPLIADPKRMFMGATAQLGVFVAFFGALLMGFTAQEAASIGIIGGADGPTAIQVTRQLAPHLLGAIAIAAYSYMALIPMIQPPFMRLLTTKKERAIKMEALRPVSKLELVAFPIIVTLVVGLLLPDALPLIGCLMFGNLLTVSGKTERIAKAAQNELMNIVTIFLGISVGATANAMSFLDLKTLGIIALGLAAFCVSTMGGLLGGKLMCWLTKGKINPLIGSAGVSAVPMAARVSQKVGREENPDNYLLMHAMGPNVAGVIGSAVAAGIFLALFK